MKKYVFAVLSAAMFLTACGKYETKLPTTSEEANIFVSPIENISDDFLRGVDISTALAEEQYGAKYYTEDGKEEDLFKILADSGVNCVRVRVWNDPYDKDGNPYGGGNCDAQNAVEIAKRAAKYGIPLMVDFHYSDFWADPSKQMCPKAWEGMTSKEKGEAAYSFTYETLEKIIKAGGTVSLVQVGNETNTGLSGEKLWSAVTDIMKGGSRAVRDISEKYKNDIKVCVHFTNPEDSANIMSIIGKLKNYELDYDVFALSYYPYWHGTLDNLSKLMERIQSDYGKETLVAENAYMFTTEDGDGNGNSVSEKDLCDEYAATVQSQANEIRDVCECVSNAGGLGVFYWEPAWIPVDSTTWEKGTGWATSFAGEYDPDDAGVYYGGCAWDNQTLFDFDGTALSSLSVFKYLKYGATCEPRVDFVNDYSATYLMGEKLKLPETLMAYYNDRSLNGESKVTWDADEIAKIDTKVPGEYTVSGSFDDGTNVNAHIRIQGANLLKNESFEDSDRSMWTIDELNGQTVDFQQKAGDAHTGEWAMHYWNSNAVSFTASQTVTGLENGKYTLSCYTQGGDNGAVPSMYLFAMDNGKEYREDYLTDSWINWKNPVITGIEVTDGQLTFGITVDAGTGAWGTIDDFLLYKEN